MQISMSRKRRYEDTKGGSEAAQYCSASSYALRDAESATYEKVWRPVWSDIYGFAPNAARYIVKHGRYRSLLTCC